MMKSVICVAALFCANNAFATCAGDSLEIGDIGPSADLLCASLEAAHPGVTIEITNRQILTGDRVSIDYRVNQQQHRVGYRLAGANWVPIKSMLAVTH